MISMIPMIRVRTLWLATLLLLGLAAHVWRETPNPAPGSPPASCRRVVQIGSPQSPVSCLDPGPPRPGFASRWPPRCRDLPAPEQLQPGDRVVVQGDRCRVLRMAPGQIETLGLPVALNRASAKELRLLPGVGRTLARRILRARRRLGPFRRPEDLYRVQGVGPRLLARLRRRIVF